MSKTALSECIELDGRPIPSGWRVATLPEISKRIKAGGTPRRGVAEFWRGDVPFVKIEDITSASGGEIFQTSEFITEAGLNGSSAWLIDPGAVLIAMYASIGATAINRIPVATNQAILAIEPDESRVDPWFLYYAFRHAAPRLASHNIQTTQKNVSKAIMEHFPIALPKLDEQRAIASVLRAVQQAKESTGKVIVAARELKRSLMRHLFTYGPGLLRDAGSIELQDFEVGQAPRGWSMRTVDEIARQVTVGIVVRPASYYVPDGIPAFRSLNVREDRLNTNDLVTIDPKAHATNLAKSVLAAGDVLVVRTGYPGTSCVVPPEFNQSNCIDLVIVRPNGGLVLSEYLSRFFNSEFGKRQFVAAKVGLAQQHLNVGALKRTVVPVPPLEVQERVVQVLASLDAKLHAEEMRHERLVLLLASLLAELMTGQRRVLHPEVA